METDQICQLIEAVANSSLTEFSYSEGDVRLVLKKAQPVVIGAEGNPCKAAGFAGDATRIPGDVTGAAASGSFPTVIPEGMVAETVVHSPLVGTFYSSPSEGTEAFVHVGDSVRKGQVLGIIETMKLMNEIECEKDGIVTAVLVENEQVVEYGQPLFRIR